MSVANWSGFILATLVTYMTESSKFILEPVFMFKKKSKFSPYSVGKITLIST